MRVLFVAIGLAFIALATLAVGHSAAAESGTIPPVSPQLLNSDFECMSGYYEETNAIGQTIRVPVHWFYRALDGAPKANSARIQYTGSCDGSGHVERISGEDSFSLRSQDMETPPAPGKPFDSVLYQQVAVDDGGAYSLSGWALTLCGGSAVPSDCPDSVYMAKMLGLDPTGGTDPEADTVVWVENRRNFVTNDNQRIGWQNIYLPADASGSTMTIFARIHSPFQWHGNHGFIDALSLIRAPVAALAPLPEAVDGGTVNLEWDAAQSPDVEAVPGGNYRLYVDIEQRLEGAEWREVGTLLVESGMIAFQAPCLNKSYDFRVRARAEQPDDEDGAWPNHRYPGVWSDIQSVYFSSAAPATAERVYSAQGRYTEPRRYDDNHETIRVFLPLVQRDVSC